jgi:hypothetical protein
MSLKQPGSIQSPPSSPRIRRLSKKLRTQSFDSRVNKIEYDYLEEDLPDNDFLIRPTDLLYSIPSGKITDDILTKIPRISRNLVNKKIVKEGDKTQLLNIQNKLKIDIDKVMKQRSIDSQRKELLSRSGTVGSSSSSSSSKNEGNDNDVLNKLSPKLSPTVNASPTIKNSTNPTTSDSKKFLNLNKNKISFNLNIELEKKIKIMRENEKKNKDKDSPVYIQRKPIIEKSSIESPRNSPRCNMKIISETPRTPVDLIENEDRYFKRGSVTLYMNRKKIEDLSLEEEVYREEISIKQKLLILTKFVLFNIRLKQRTMHLAMIEFWPTHLPLIIKIQRKFRSIIEKKERLAGLFIKKSVLSFVKRWRINRIINNVTIVVNFLTTCKSSYPVAIIIKKFKHKVLICQRASQIFLMNTRARIATLIMAVKRFDKDNILSSCAFKDIISERLYTNCQSLLKQMRRKYYITRKSGSSILLKSEITYNSNINVNDIRNFLAAKKDDKKFYPQIIEAEKFIPKQLFLIYSLSGIDLKLQLIYKDCVNLVNTLQDDLDKKLDSQDVDLSSKSLSTGQVLHYVKKHLEKSDILRKNQLKTNR